MKHLTGVLSLVLFAALPLSAADLSDLTWTTTNGEVTITDCNRAATGELVIPDTIEGNPVTSIRNFAFDYCTSLTSVTIGNGVSRIGDYAFRNCRSLTRITIHEGVTSIGTFAFQNCTSLTSITIPNSVTSIGNGTFSICARLSSITIPDGVTSIGDWAFYDCVRLIDITIGQSVTSIGESAFRDCYSLTSVTIPNSVTSIGKEAFLDCENLTSITIGQSVSSIGDSAFEDSRSLTNITFLGTAPTVGVSALFGISEEAQAFVSGEFADSFGGFGSTWEGLPVSSPVGSTIGAAIVTGSGSVEGVGTFTNGTSVTLTATPAAGQVFIAWTGDASGSENPLTLTVEGDINIGAIFIEPAAYALVTQESFDEVVAERDARYTEDQIRALSADYTIGLNDAGNVQMKLNLFESTDLNTFAPLTLNPDSVSVVDGSICLEFAPEGRAAFFRFSVE